MASPRSPEMTPADIARVDQVRADAREALTIPCECGECLTDDQLRQILAMSDEEILEVLNR